MTGAPFPKYPPCKDCGEVQYVGGRINGRCEECSHKHTMQQVFGEQTTEQAGLGEFA